MRDFDTEIQEQAESHRDWKSISQMVSDLPTLPHIAAQAMVVVEDPNANAQKLAQLINQDVALASRVLKIANSAMFSRRRQITTLNQAIMIIGFKTLRGVIVAAALQRFSQSAYEVDRLVWENSVATAVSAHALAYRLGKRYLDEVFLIGLLHDLGKMVMMKQIRHEYIKLVKLTRQGKTFFEVEQENLGFAHPLIGALVAKKWNFPNDLCQAILHHHDPLDSNSEDEQQVKTLIIQVSDTVAHALGHGHMEGYPSSYENGLRALERLGLDDAMAAEFMEHIEQLFQNQIGALL